MSVFRSLICLTLNGLLIGATRHNKDTCSPNDKGSGSGCSSSSGNHLIDDTSETVFGSSSCVVKEGKDLAFKEYLAKTDLINKARNWDGNIYYYALQDIKDPHKFRWFEAWENIPKAMNWIENYGGKVFTDVPELDDILSEPMQIDGTFKQLIYPAADDGASNTVNNNIEHMHCSLCNELYDWKIDTPSYSLFGADGISYSHNGVGERVSSLNSLDNGVVSSYRVAYNVPLGRNALWHAFDNYFEFQSLNREHPNTIHYSGPDNKVGEIVQFTFEDYMYDKYGFIHAYEKLNLKDDENYVWQVDCAPLKYHPLFDRYLYTARIYEDYYNNTYPNGGSLLVTDMEFSFYDNVSLDIRNEILSYGKANSAYYAKYIFDIAFDKVGTHIPYDFNVKVPTEWLFNYLSDWRNTKWVLASVEETLNMLQSDVRSLGTTSGMTLIERVSESKKLDDNTYLFEYQVMNGDMPLRDTLTLISKNNGKTTNVKGKLSIYPKPKDKDAMKAFYEPVIQMAVDNWPQVLLKEFAKSKKQ